MKRLNTITTGIRSPRNEIYSTKYFTFYQYSGIGMNDTPYTNHEVMPKDKNIDVYVRINKNMPKFEGEPVTYEIRGASVSIGASSLWTIEDVNKYIEVMQDACEMVKYINNLAE